MKISHRACVLQEAGKNANIHAGAIHLENGHFSGNTLFQGSRRRKLISTQRIQSVETADAPPPGGHYSQVIIANGFVFVSGQLPVKPGGHNEIPAGIDAQTRQALSNVEAILRATDSSLDRVVSVTGYVTDIKNWPEVNRVFADMFGQHRPARLTATAFGALVEIQAVALAGR